MEHQYFDNNSKNIVKDALFSPLFGVELTGGLFREAFANNIRFLKRLNKDAMLYWFRKRAGKEAPGKPYTGHFEDNIKGQTAGLFLMGAGNALRWVEDAELRRTLDAIVTEIADCSEPDGYLMAVPKEEFGTKEYPHYVRIWLTYGLTAAALAGDERAFTMLRKWQDWFNRCDDLPVIKYLVLAFQGVVASTYLYNTPIGKPEDIDVTVKYYEEDWRLAQFINGEREAIHVRRQPGVEPHAHGTEIEAMEGYLDLYRATGRHYYLRAVKNFYEFYKLDWQYPGGGIAMCEAERSFPKCYWLSPDRHYNELCCASFWLLLNQRFHRLYPDDESYVSEMESVIYNVGIANQIGDENISYFALLDQNKAVRPDTAVHCCSGVGTKMYGSMPEYIYSISPDTLSVDLFAASRFAWQRESGEVGVETETNMPYDGGVCIRFRCAPQEFSLRVRIPRWAAKEADILVNGKSAARGKPGSYVSITRTWRTGDNVSITLQFAWKFSLYEGAEQVEGFRRYSYEYGPLLMAFKGPLDADARLKLDYDPERLPGLMNPDGEPAHFSVKGLPPVEVVPYLEINLNEPFTCFPLFTVSKGKAE